MGCETLHCPCECIDDEPYMFGGHPLDGLLNHVIPILVLNTFENVILKFFNQLRLLIGQDVFKSLDMLGHFQENRRDRTDLLNNSTSIHL